MASSALFGMLALFNFQWHCCVCSTHITYLCTQLQKQHCPHGGVHSILVDLLILNQNDGSFFLDVNLPAFQFSYDVQCLTLTIFHVVLHISVVGNDAYSNQMIIPKFHTCWIY